MGEVLMNSVTLRGIISRLKRGTGQSADFCFFSILPDGSRTKATFDCSAFNEVARELAEATDGARVELAGHLEKRKRGEAWEVSVVADEIDVLSDAEPPPAGSAEEPW